MQKIPPKLATFNRPRLATIKKYNPDEDLQFILATKGVQTEDDEVIGELMDYKNAYNELYIQFQTLDAKYEFSKGKFQNLKNMYEELQQDYKVLPTVYKDAFHEANKELVVLRQKYKSIKDGLRNLL